MPNVDQPGLDARLLDFRAAEIPTAEDAEVEYKSNVVTSAIHDTIAIFGKPVHGTERNNDGRRVPAVFRTLEVILSDDEGAPMYTLESHLVRGSLHQERVLRITGSADSPQKEVVFNHRSQNLTDGQENPIEDQAGIRLALETVEALRERLRDAALDTMKRIDANYLVMDELHGRQEEHEKALDKIAADLKHIEGLDLFEEMSVRVHIKSGWEDQGEEPYGIEITKVTLDEAIYVACANFKEKNGRSDVQGSFTVEVVLPNGNHVEIPREYWEESAAYHSRSQNFDLHKKIQEEKAQREVSLANKP